MKWKSTWPIFHGPVILHYISKTIWCMNMILWDYESVWPDIWPKNKYVTVTYISWSSDFALYFEDCLMYVRDYESVWADVWPKTKCRSLWPMFYGPVILRYILKTIWCTNIIFWDYESVWHDIWTQNKCRSPWPRFHGQVILSYILKTIWYMDTVLCDYESVWPVVWPEINIGDCDLYFMASDFALYLENYSVAEDHIWDYESVWPDVWPQNICRSLWPIFHGPLNLPYIMKTVWCMNTFGTPRPIPWIRPRM